jgi:hypothetical protein
MAPWLTESVPAAIRSTGVAVVQAVSVATFGGTTQFAVTGLLKATGNPWAPARRSCRHERATKESAPCQDAEFLNLGIVPETTSSVMNR